MSFQLSVHKQQQKRVLGKILKHVSIFACALAAMYACYIILNSPNREFAIVGIGLCGLYNLSVIPHYFNSLLQLRITIRNLTHTWVMRDKSGKIVASYPSLQIMKKQNPAAFKPYAKRERYVINNTETGEVGGEFITEEIHHWKPTIKKEEISNENQ